MQKAEPEQPMQPKLKPGMLQKAKQGSMNNVMATAEEQPKSSFAQAAQRGKVASKQRDPSNGPTPKRGLGDSIK